MDAADAARVAKKVASFQVLDEGEELVWLVVQAAHRRNKMKKRAIRACSSTGVGDWPKGWGTDATLAVALILNRHDVLSRSAYTILQAMERINPIWAQSLAEIESELRSDGLLPGRLPR